MLHTKVSMIAICTLWSGQALAQQAIKSSPSPEQFVTTTDAASSGDIIVTAQRRSENLQKVPITVQAVTPATLSAAGITNPAQIQAVVPGLVIQRTFAGAAPFLRGVGTNSNGFTAENAVATYIDGIYLPNAASGVFAFNNIERLEVVKGPQGTLFGRNAVGGLIQIITRDPSHTSHVEGSVSYGNYDTIDANVYATTGLTDTLALDIAATHHDQQDGWGRNPITGSEQFKHRETSIASKAIWEPSDRTKVVLRGFYDHSNSDQGAVFGVYPGAVGTDGTTYGSKYDIPLRIDPKSVSSQYNVGLRIEQDLDFARLVSLTGYNHVKSDALAPQNGIPGQPVIGRSTAWVHNLGRSNTFTQEVQLLSQASGPLQWIVGGFFMRDHFNLRFDLFPTCVNGVCAAAPVPARTYGIQTLKSYAGFGEATLSITDAARVTVGLRYTHDKKDLSDSYREPLAGFPTTPVALAGPLRPGAPGAVAPTASFSKLTWRGVFAYDYTPDVMGYASINRGFKAGAYNPVAFTNPIVRPEVLDAYEVGIKARLFDRKLRLNLSSFYYDYKDIHLRTFAPPAPVGATILYNAASAHIKGIEGDFNLLLGSQLTINGGFTLLDAKYSDFPAGICTFPVPIAGNVLGGVASRSCNLEGSRLPRAAKFSGNMGFTYRVPTSIGEVTLTASDAYNSGFYWDVDNRLKQRAYHQVSASVTWTAPDEQFNAQLYARNINKPYYFISAYEGAAGVDTYSPGDPRTYGVKLGFQF